MTHADEIDKAVGAHGMWKVRLRSAIATGRIDLPVDAIRTDQRCEFGRWLHGPSVPASTRASAHYRTVRDLHAAFHRAAAQVAELAVAGKRHDAEQMLAGSGEYGTVSARLTQAMQEWKKAVAADTAAGARA